MTRELFFAGALPVMQNRTFATIELARSSPTGDIRLVQDERTGLISNADFDAARLHYGPDYQNEQASSLVFQRHLDDVSAIIASHFKGQRLIEVGCGKGYFLEHLRTQGYDVTGIDPAYEGNSPDVIKAPFERGLGLSADGIILRHVLEHIPDPMAFLAEIAQANEGSGTIYIEVPCFDWILERRAWFDVFYEHVNYFRAIDLQNMFSRVYACGHVFGGQYLYLVADLASLRRPQAGANGRVSMPDDFLAGVDRAVSLVRSDRTGRTAIWGSASKGVIFAVYLQRRGIEVDLAIDINPAKQGRFLPITGLAVMAPESAACLLGDKDRMFVMNSNYLDEIVFQSNRRYTYLTVDHE